MKHNSNNERARIDNLLSSGRISPGDHEILLAALDKRTDPVRKILGLAVNPFEKLSIVTGLIAGSTFVVLMGLLGAKFSIYFPGAIDFQIAQEGKRIYSALELMAQNAVNILCLAGAFYLGSVFLRQRNLRAVDFLSSVALARFPFAALVLILSGLGPIFPSILPRKVEGAPSAGSLALAVFAIVFLVWHLILLFSAAKESSGLKGKTLWIVFIGGLIAAEAASYGLNALLLK